MRSRSVKLWVAAIAVFVIIASCGGGGDTSSGTKSYSVGGTVSGLTGTVVLQNNGADDLTITADGSFTFATKVADGGAYSVAVLTQPVGQTCMESSNTGTIAGANVTNVSVACTTAQYATNGTVYAVAVGPDGTTYIGGNFTQVGPATGGWAPIDAGAGALPPSFPKVAGVVSALAPDGSGGWYIGGLFTAVGGVSRNNLAHILADGSVDPAWDPNANDGVSALAVSGGTVYAGGAFTTMISGVTTTTRNYLAAIGTDGTLGAWNPNANSAVNALAVSGSTVYAGGWFTTMGGTARNYLAAIGPDGTLGA